LVLVVFPARIKPLAPAQMNDHPDAPKQFGIRLSDETMELVSEIQHHRKRTNQPTTLAAIVEDAIEIYYEDLVEAGEIQDEL